MIRYHGGPVTPLAAAAHLWTGRHAMISYAHPEQVALAAEVSQSFVLDNGAFTFWKSGGSLDVDGYEAFVREWSLHPGFDWCLIPDIIDGDELDNRSLVESWTMPRSVPVWHLHESLDYLGWLADRFDRVALGSSGEFADPGTAAWWGRMAEAMGVVCDDMGRPRVKIHGLRMMSPDIFSRVPLASADSCNVARNIGIDKAWQSGAYTTGLTKRARAAVVADRCEAHECAAVWSQHHAPHRQAGLFG